MTDLVWALPLAVWGLVVLAVVVWVLAEALGRLLARRDERIAERDRADRATAVWRSRTTRTYGPGGKAS